MNRKLWTLLLLAALLVTSLPAVAQDAETTITFWSNEFQPERVERQQAIIDAFEAANPGVSVELAVMDENLMDQLMTLNVAAGTPPDVILHPLQLSAKWYSQGLLDADFATTVINDLGVDTFSAGALDLLAQPDGDGWIAIPSDGWGQMLLYRSDLFDAAGLEAPDTYEKIMAAAEALNDPDNGMIGFCGPNHPGEVYTWQMFEHIALANGANFVDDEGNIAFDSPEMIEAMQFYVDLMNNYGPNESEWYWLQTRAEYLAGNCGMTMWSPFILDEMAGLRDSVLPTCAECENEPAFIARNTSVVSAIQGPSGDAPAAWGSVNSLGIAPNASPEAQAFIEFWMNDAYLDGLGIAAEGKFPMRRGTAEEPNLYVEGWSNLDVGVDLRAPLSDFYDAATLQTIVEGADGYSRMGFGQGFEVLASAISSQFFIEENLAAALNGEISVDEAAENIQIEIEDLAVELETE
jgi:multiple sugar transport system substrate-binding protein